MKLFVVKPFDYTDERTPVNSPWKSEYNDYNGQLFVRADNSSDARDLASLDDKGRALGIIEDNIRRNTPLIRACEEHTGEIMIKEICPYLNPQYTDCFEVIINENGVLKGDIYISV